MRVVLDARKLTHGGIGVYIQNLIAGFLEEGVESTLIADPDDVRNYDWASSVNVFEDRTAPYSVSELLTLGKKYPLRSFDVFHEPHYTLPLGIPIPSVVTIHDLIHFYFPEKFHYPLVSSTLIRSALHRASKVVTVSESTCRDIYSLARGNPRLTSKVHVIPNALDPVFLKSASSSDFVKGRFRLTGRYFLSVSSMLKPHKGVLDLIRAFQRLETLRSELDLLDCKLVCVGKGTETLCEIEKVINEVGSTRGIRLFGTVTREELFHLYGSAAALVVPSRAEGFCLPVIEAQARGTPVIARPVPAILELLTRSDMACADFEEESITETLITFLRRLKAASKVPQIPSPDSERERHLAKFQRRHVCRKVLALYTAAIEARQRE